MDAEASVSQSLGDSVVTDASQEENPAQKRPRADYIVIDKISEVFDMTLLGLKKASVIGLAMEGISKGRRGELSWIQICLDNHTILFDMVMLGDEVFDEGLKEILENPNIVKVVHDCRPVSDYLYRRRGIRIINVFDTQIADVVVFKRMNLEVFPAKTSPLLVCLLDHLLLPSDVFSTRYIKVLYEENDEIWCSRPAEDYVLEAAVFKVFYLPLLRSTLLRKMLSRFTDGCDIYLGLMRDAADSQITRLENQMHLAPSEFQNLAYYGAKSRQYAEELQTSRPEPQHRSQTRHDILLEDGCSATFFTGGGRRFDLDRESRDVGYRDTKRGTRLDGSGDEEQNDDVTFSDIEYDLLMHSLEDDFDNEDEDEVAEEENNSKDGNNAKAPAEGIDSQPRSGLDNHDAGGSVNTKHSGKKSQHVLLPENICKSEVDLDATAETRTSKKSGPSAASNGSFDACNTPSESLDSAATLPASDMTDVREIMSRMAVSAPKSDGIVMVPAGHEKLFWKPRYPPRNFTRGFGNRRTQRGRFNYRRRFFGNRRNDQETFDSGDGIRRVNAHFGLGFDDDAHVNSTDWRVSGEDSNEMERAASEDIGNKAAGGENEEQCIVIGLFDFGKRTVPKKNSSKGANKLGPQKSRAPKSKTTPSK